MSYDFAEHKLLIMKELDDNNKAIDKINNLLTDHLADYNLFKGKIYGAVVLIPMVISIIGMWLSIKANK